MRRKLVLHKPGSSIFGNPQASRRVHEPFPNIPSHIVRITRVACTDLRWLSCVTCNKCVAHLPLLPRSDPENFAARYGFLELTV